MASTSPYKKTSMDWLPAPMISYEGEYVYLRGETAGVKGYTNEWLETSVFVSYDPSGFQTSDSDDTGMQQLSNRSSSALGGVEVVVLTPVAMLHTSVAMDILNQSRGLVVEAGLKHSWESGPLEIIPSAGVRFTNRMYNSYYFGITQGEAEESGLPSYKASSGLSPYFGLLVDYSLTEALEFIAGAELSYLAPSVRNSPMVEDSSTLGFTMGLTYSF